MVVSRRCRPTSWLVVCRCRLTDSCLSLWVEWCQYHDLKKRRVHLPLLMPLLNLLWQLAWKNWPSSACRHVESLANHHAWRNTCQLLTSSDTVATQCSMPWKGLICGLEPWTAFAEWSCSCSPSCLPSSKLSIFPILLVERGSPALFLKMVTVGSRYL